MRITTKLFVSGIAVIAFSLVITGFRRVSVLRLSDAVDLRVNTQSKRLAVITGGMTHSGMTVDGTAVERRDRTAYVRVYIAPITGNSGNGSYSVRVPLEGVDEVSFGDPAGTRTIGLIYGFDVRVPASSSSDMGGVIWSRATK